MLAEVNQTIKYLEEKFGDVNSIPPGTYPIPTYTSKGKAYMKVVIGEDMRMSDFSLWLDENFEKDWHELTVCVNLFHTETVLERLIEEVETRYWGYIKGEDHVSVFLPVEEIAGLFYVGLIVA